MNKKAIVTTSLSWMIMAIIGAFFIVFGYSIVQDYQEVETEKFQLELQQTLNHIFTLVGQSTGVETTSLESLNNLFNNREVEMFCREGIPTISVDGVEDTSAQFIQANPVVMTKIDSSRVDSSYIAVEQFQLPYRVSPIMAIVSLDNLYVIDSESEIANRFQSKFDRFSAFNELSVEFVDFENDLDQILEQINSGSYSSVSFINDKTRTRDDFFETKFEDISTYAIHITLTTEEFSIGAQTHYNGTIRYVRSTENQEYDENEYSFPYTDWGGNFALPTMALFSKPEVFQCAQPQIYEAVEEATRFYKTKAEELEKKEILFCREGLNIGDQQRYYRESRQTLEKAIDEENFINLKDTQSMLREIFDRNNRLVENRCITLY